MEIGGPAILYAFNALNLDNVLYSSNQFSFDDPGPAVKFTVSNGSQRRGLHGNADPARRIRIVPRWRKKSVEFQSRFAVIRQQGDSRNYPASPRTVTLTNTSKKKTGVSRSVAMQTATPSVFTMKSECEKTLDPGKTCKVKVTFTPTDTTPTDRRI